MKRTKTVFYLSLVSVLLCVAMLTGTTFAWFTDTATSGSNKIVAGNLKVDLIMDKACNGTYESIANETGAIFGAANSLYAQNNSADTVWEPGKTQIVYLGVKNNGNLALKYYISLTVKGDLAPALEYAIIDGAKASDLASAADWTAVKSAAGTQTGDVTVGTFTAAGNGVLDEIANGTQGETDYFALAIHMKADAGNDYQKKDITIDLTVYAGQKAAESDSFNNQYDNDAPVCFGPQYKYEINQLAQYLNMDGDELENLLLAWTKDTSNRDKSYADLLDGITTKNDALCITAVYILGTEHFMVSDSTVSNTASTEFSKAILSSDVIFKGIKQIFEQTSANDTPDEYYTDYLRSNTLNSWNGEMLACLGLGGSGKVPVTDIYDAFRYSIEHANEESSVGSTYTLTANAIYKIINLACPNNDNISLNYIKASMDRMLARSAAGTVLDLQTSRDVVFGDEASEDEKKQIAYDYAIYCYMCMFGLLSGDPAHTALSRHFTSKEFTSEDAICYALNSDCIFKRIAGITESLQTGNYGTIMSTAYNYLNDYNMLSDIYDKYTDDCNEMYKAIGEIFNY